MHNNALVNNVAIRLYPERATLKMQQILARLKCLLRTATRYCLDDFPWPAKN